MKTFIIIFFINVFSIAQEEDPIEFFPHHEGEIFEYADGSSSGYFQSVITKDSLGDDGKYYLDTKYYGDSPISTYFGKWLIDTNKYEVYRDYEATFLEFKLNADSGDTWIVFDDNPNSFVRAEVVDVFPAFFLGEEVVIKNIEYTSYEYSDTTQGLYIYAYYISSKFGIISEYGDPPGFPTYSLRGARINNVTYGIVTSTDRQPESFQKGFILVQNYPNPFNPITQIKYQIPEDGYVALKVFDILGREVAVLVDEEKIAGTYIVNFDGSYLSSGIYFYSITAGAFNQVKKMLLVK